MINYFLSELKKNYECKQIDVGDFREVKIEGSKITIEAFDVDGVGRVSTVEVIGFLKLWKMQSVIINPLEKDAPIYYYHRHNRKGRDICKIEVLDMLLEVKEYPEFDAILEKYADIQDLEDKPNWYDEIKMPSCILKTVKKDAAAQLDEVTKDHFAVYLKVLEDSPICGKSRKTEFVKEFTDGLVDEAGIAVLQLFRSYYKKHIAKALCLDVLFGMR